jgi:hypothetical protein
MAVHVCLTEDHLLLYQAHYYIHFKVLWDSLHMRSSWWLWAHLVLMVLDCLQFMCCNLSVSRWVCILPHITFTSDDGLKNSAGLYSVFMIQVMITFCSFLYMQNFSMIHIWISSLLKCTTCFMFTIIPKEWPFS